MAGRAAEVLVFIDWRKRNDNRNCSSSTQSLWRDIGPAPLNHRLPIPVIGRQMNALEQPIGLLAALSRRSLLTSALINGISSTFPFSSVAGEEAHSSM